MQTQHITKEHAIRIITTLTTDCKVAVYKDTIEDGNILGYVYKVPARDNDSPPSYRVGEGVQEALRMPPIREANLSFVLRLIDSYAVFA